MKQNPQIGNGGTKSEQNTKRPGSRIFFDRYNFVSATQAADELGVTSREIRKLCATGKIAATRTPGGHFKIARKEIEALLQQPGPLAPSRADSSPLAQLRREGNEEKKARLEE